MQLRDALDDYKRSSGDSTLFPGERRTLSGRFSGGDGRLVHVDEGVIRDFGYPLSGLTGLERSRFGLSLGDEKFWFDDDATSTQIYDEHGGLVETVHETPVGEVTELDLTVGNAHLTHFETVVEHAEIIAYVSLAPDGRHSRLGQLHHEDVIEVYHETEHDFLGSATGFAGLRGQIPASFDDLISEDPTEYPRPPHDGRYAEDRLSGDLVCWLPLENGSTTLITLLTDWEETTREDALDQMETYRTEYTGRDAFEATATETAPLDATDDLPLTDSVSADVRVLSLLTGTTGLRMAGPDFDPYYRHSGGYGYTWFRDDAEISLFVLESDHHLGLGLRSGMPAARGPTVRPNAPTAVGPTASGHTTARSRPAGPTPGLKPATASTIRPTKPAASSPFWRATTPPVSTTPTSKPASSTRWTTLSTVSMKRCSMTADRWSVRTLGRTRSGGLPTRRRPSWRRTARWRRPTSRWPTTRLSRPTASMMRSTISGCRIAGSTRSESTAWAGWIAGLTRRHSA
jgi:hypothetical protein